MGKFTTNNIIICILTGLAALNIAPSSAEDERWFRVELVAFAHLWSEPPVGAAMEEQWDATPTLTYPAEFRFLVDPVQVEKNEGEFDGESLVDEYGRQIITLHSDLTGSAGQAPGVESTAIGTESVAAEGGLQAPRPLTPVYAEPVPEPVPESEPESMPEVVPPALPRPFLILPEAHREFHNKASRMQRSGRYSILFHETWVQPVGPEATSLPIVLDRSGDNRQWPGLQGSIKIFLERYLQVETGLWLNTTGDYLPGTWQMPAPPFGPPSLILEEEVVDLAEVLEQVPAGTEQQAEGSPAELAAGSAGTELVAPATEDPLAGMTQEEIELMELLELMDGAKPEDPFAGKTREEIELMELMALMDEEELEDELEELLEPAAPVYPFRHAVVLEQKRRMRSGEVHYIDHPLLGLIIKFTPVAEQELAAIAQSQDTRPQD